jgi:calcineurin-like phosphoesterase family protein
VGDFAYRNDKPAEWYLRQLKGHKHLIIGNHDGDTLKNEKAMAYFESVDKMIHVTDGDKQICLCHFPIAEWNGYYKGAWHIMDIFMVEKMKLMNL